MSEFEFGIAIGAAFVCGLWWATNKTYRITLLMCANHRTAEKIGGEFYYIVHESEYNEMNLALLAARAALAKAKE